MLEALLGKYRGKYPRLEPYIPIFYFILGFIFDAVTLRRIDELRTVLLQTTYLIGVGTILCLQLMELVQPVTPPRVLVRLWAYRDFILNFMLGTLLNCYTLFYFKSASALSSLFFIGALVAILILNEMKIFEKFKLQVRVAFFSLCLISYFVSFTPTLLGSIGVGSFLTATGISILIASILYWLLKFRFQGCLPLLKNHFAFPYAGVQSLFLFLYFTHSIPPVPLSLSYIGIYHQIESRSAKPGEVEGHYQLTYTRPVWKFWQNGDQTFLARKGDAIYCFIQVFSPTRFKDRIHIRWQFWDEGSGWKHSDAIPLEIVGGRDEGYRGMTKKVNYQPGSWRVLVETSDNQEIGRIRFTVEADESLDAREFHTEAR